MCSDPNHFRTADSKVNQTALKRAKHVTFSYLTQLHKLLCAIDLTSSQCTQSSAYFAASCLHDWSWVGENAGFGSKASGWIWSMQKVSSPVRKRIKKGGVNIASCLEQQKLSHLEYRPLRRAFRCAARWTGGLQVLMLAWQPPPLHLPQPVLVIIPPLLWPLPLPPSPRWPGRLVPVLWGPGRVRLLIRTARGSRHAPVQRWKRPRWQTGLWVLHPEKQRALWNDYLIY